MRITEKEIKKMSQEELKAIMDDSKASYAEIIMASVEFNQREYKKGNFYTVEEIIEYFENYHTAQLW